MIIFAKNKQVKRILFLFTLLIIFSGLIFAQNRQITSLKASADREFKEKNYYGAVMFYKECLKYDNRRHDIIWKIAEAARLDNDYAEAVKYYKIICEKYSEKYSYAYFYYAQMLKSEEKYLQAQYNFQVFLKQDIRDINPEFVKIAKDELINCEYAWKNINRPIAVEIKHCDSSINSVYSDFSPVITKNGLLVFSSIRPLNNIVNNYKSKIYVAGSNNLILFDTAINILNKDISNICFNSTNNKCFFTCTENDHTQIYLSNFSQGKWDEPKKLPPKINIDGFNTTQPFLVEFKDSCYLLWSSDKPGSEGGFDIYFAKMISDTNFGEIKNLGRPIIKNVLYANFYDTTSIINTKGNEITPFYDIQDSTLYFSSDSYQSFGGYDIFKVKGDFVRWKKIENLGYPINSAQNDLYFKMFRDEGLVYFASNRKSSYYVKNQSCCNDIYYFDIEKNVYVDTTVLEEKRIETLTEKITLLVPITLYFNNDYPNPNSWDTITKRNYSDLYFEYITYQEKFRNIFSKGLQKIEKFAAIDSIDNYFSEYVQVNYEKLLEFTNLMKELLISGQKIEITIKGYTSPLNTIEYNNNLAKRRISSLVNYFEEFDYGYFLPYIENKQMNFSFVAFGKTLSDGKVSDDPKDPRNSIYSPAASRERRIEIIAVSVDK